MEENKLHQLLHTPGYLQDRPQCSPYVWPLRRAFGNLSPDAMGCLETLSPALFYLGLLKVWL